MGVEKENGVRSLDFFWKNLRERKLPLFLYFRIPHVFFSLNLYEKIDGLSIEDIIQGSKI